MRKLVARVLVALSVLSLVNFQQVAITADDLPANDNWFGGIGPAVVPLTSTSSGESKPLWGCVNDYCPSVSGFNVGPIVPFFIESSTTGERRLGWCTQPGIVAVADPLPYNVVTNLDGRLQYLLWKYDYAYQQANGISAVDGAAIQALVWAWRTTHGSDVFDGIDPLNWNNLAVDTYVAGNGGLTAGRVGFTGETADNGHNGSLWMEDEDLLAANQATYDLAVEATANAGPWALNTANYDGVTLTGANGAISGVTLTFNAGGTVVTNGSGYAAWPDGATTVTLEAPGTAYETQPAASQNIMISVSGSTINGTRSAAPTTTTTTTTTTTQPPEEPALTGGDEPGYTG